MIKSLILTNVLLLSSLHLFAQDWKIGTGFFFNETYSSGRGVTVIHDSTFLLSKSGRSSWEALTQDDDVNLALFIEKTIIKKVNYEISSSITYFKRYMDIKIRYFERNFPLTGSIPVSNATFISQLSFGFIPYDRLKISTGLGIGLHFKKVVSEGDFTINPIIRQTYEDAQHIGRFITFNYQLKMSYDISERIETALFYYQSMGRIDRKIEINGSSYELPLQWQALGISVAYKMNLFN